MTEETIWQFEIQPGSSMTTIEELDAALASILEKITQVVDAASSLPVLDESFSALSSSAMDASTGVEGLDEAMASLQGQVNEDTVIIDALNATIGNLEAQLAMLTTEEAGAGEGAGAMAAMMAGAGEAITAVGDALTAAQGPLVMLSMAGIMAGKSLFDAGVQGQDGIALVQGMAGATDQDVQNLESSAMKLGDTMQEASAGFYDVASAGYKGSQATEVFTAATEAAKASQSALHPVTTALTSIMAAYGEGADQAKGTTDQMIETVLVGKQSFEAFASAIGPLAATGHNVGLSFAEVAAAESTMTQINPNVRQDTMELNSLFTNMDMSMDKVANTAKGLNLKFSETHYASLNLIDKLKYLADVSGGTNTVAFSKMVGGVNGVKSALALLSNQGDTYTGNLSKIQGSQGATDKAFERSEQTVSSHMDKMGAAFSIFSTKFMDALGPKLIPVLDALSSGIAKFSDFMVSHMDIMMPVLVGLAVFFGVVIVGAIVAFAISLGTAAAIVLGVAAAIGLAVGLIVYAVTHWGDITKWLQGVWAGFVSWFMGLLGGIGAWFTSLWSGIASFFVGVWHGAIAGVQSAWSGVISWFQGLFGAIGAFFVSVWSGIAGFFVGLWNGIISFLQAAWGVIVNVIKSGALLALAMIFSPFIAIGALFIWLYQHNYYFQALIDSIVGFVRVGLAWLVGAWQGFVSWLAGLWQGAVGLATSAWNAVTNAITIAVNATVNALRIAWQASINFIVGLWNGAVGLANAAWGAVSGVVMSVINPLIGWLRGVWQGAISNLGALWGTISGLAQRAWAGVTGVFSGVWGTISGILGGLWNNFSSWFLNLAGQFLTWGGNVISGFIQGIKDKIAGIGTTLAGAADTVKNFLGFHSPTKEGPGREADEWAPAFVDMFASGLEAGVPQIQSAMGKLAVNLHPSALISSPLPSSSFSGSSGTSDGGNDQAVAILAQILTVLQQQDRGSNVTNNTRITPGSMNSQAVNQAVQALSGWGYEGLQRGGY